MLRFFKFNWLAWEVSGDWRRTTLARKPSTLRNLSHPVSRHMANVQESGSFVLDCRRSRSFEGRQSMGRTQRRRATFYFARFSLFCCEWRNCKRKPGKAQMTFTAARPHSWTLIIFSTVFRWSASVRKCKWRRHAVFTVFKSQSRMFTRKCTACWSIRTSKTHRNGPLKALPIWSNSS